MRRIIGECTIPRGDFRKLASELNLLAVQNDSREFRASLVMEGTRVTLDVHDAAKDLVFKKELGPILPNPFTKAA